MRLGFSIIGLIIFIIPMLINILYFVLPSKNKAPEKVEENSIIELVEKITRVAYSIVLCFLVSSKEINFKSPLLFLSIIFIVLYYIVWFRYFIGGRDERLLGEKFLFIPMPLAIFPVLYFIFAAVWLNNYLATVIMIVFGVAHNIISYKNFYHYK